MRVISGTQLVAMVHQYGYLGLMVILILGIVGLPLPDETILTMVGYLVYRGHLLYFPALLAGVLGSMIGITISYSLGVFLGRPLLLEYGHVLHLNEKRIKRVEEFLDHYGAITIGVGFFIPGVRHVTAIVAGVGNMKFPRFAFAAYTGACLWVTTFITLGRFVGPSIAGLHVHLPAGMVWIFAASGLGLIASWVLGTRIRQRRSRR